MALTFEESKKQLAQAMAAAAKPAVMSMHSVDEPVMMAAYENWEKPANASFYEYYNNEYYDDKLSTVDENKNITLSMNQINLTQETNSQYIPFQIPRFYDGFDLANTELSVYWVNKHGQGGPSIPVDVYYSADKIKFAWLVDDNVTAVAGKIQFEIQASGENSKGYKYVWKTKTCDGINVLQALEIKQFIEPDDSWQESFIDKLSAKVEAAEAQADRAAAQATTAKNAASVAEGHVAMARQYAQEANNLVQELEQGINSKVREVVEAEVVTALEQAAAEFEEKIPTKVSELTNDENYATTSDIDSAIQGVNSTIQGVAANIPSKLSQLENDASLTTESYVQEYVTAKISEVDVKDQLVDYALKADVPTIVSELDLSEHPSIKDLATEQYVNDAIAAADLDNYYKKDETYSAEEIDDKLDNVSVDLSEYYTKSEVDTVISNVEVDLSGYYTKTETDAQIAPAKSAADAATTNVAALSKTVTDLQTTVNSIDTSPRLTYDVKYNDTEDADVGENVFAFYEITNEGKENESREIKQKFTIVGGSGGGSASSTLKIGYITTSPFVVTINDSAILKFTFSGTDSSGDVITEGNAVWKVNGRTVATSTVVAGENSFDLTEYINVGSQKVNLTVTDDAGSLVSKNWTVQKIDVRLESTFNDKFTYPLGDISFDYTPYGAVEKTVHFVLDGKEIGTTTTSASGIPMAYTIPAQAHGAHLLEVYMTAVVNNNTIESNHIVKDILWYDATSTVPVIGCVQQKFTALQYDSTNIVYTVYDPSTETPTVTLAVDGVVVSTLTVDSNTQTWQYKSADVGEHVLTITCGTTVKRLVATIEKLDIDVAPVTAGLVFDFDPSGKSNNDADRLWSNGTVAMTVSNNFDWVNGGYQIDANGDQYFCIKAGTTAEINYQLFADDAKKNGKEFKLVFKSTNVATPDAVFLSCMDNTTGTDHIGIQMGVHEASIYGQAGSLTLPYSEEDIIEFEFNISKNTEAIPMVMGYEDGVSTRPMVYDDSYNFTQNTPKIISLGSADCDLHIYRFKVYDASLTDRGILNNFIADARNAEEMINRYTRNQIYNENSQLDPDILAAKCPWLRVYKLSAPYFTNNKSDKVPGTTIQQIYKNGDPVLDNWTCYDCSHSGQGTSSNNYGAAGRNLDFIMNKSQIEGVKPYFILGDGSRASKITMTRTSVPVAYLNAKVNIASSNNLTNAMLANRYNEFNPYKRQFIRTASLSDAYSDDEIAVMTEEEQATALAALQEKVNAETAYIKDTMEFHNCVIFIQETNEDLSTHREFNDTNWHFYAIGNIGDSKKTDETRLTDMDDKYECCVEIMDVELPLSDFPVDTMMNAMGYKTDEATGEKIYTWAKDSNLGILYEKVGDEYVLTQDTAINLSKTYYVDILEHDDFSEDYTYGWRYLYEGDDDEENAEVARYCHQKWIEFYRFITTSTDEEFKAHLGDYMVLDSALYYYLFTTRYTMADNRAKNSFWHYGKTGEVDSDGNPIRKFDLAWGYDMDTSLGLNNYGAQVYRYGLEDTDRDEKGEEVFREMDSTFFCRLRNLFPNELKAMYNTLESKNAWHAESFLNKADAWQSEFPEELWRIDIERKYIRTYNSSFINGKGDAQFLVNMSNGKMKYHRRQWERSQEKYMASKYQSSVASSDNAVLRCTVPTGNLTVQPNYRIKLTPYAYMYLNVKYGTQNPIQLRAEPNVEYEIPFEGNSADIIDIYSSSLIQSFGDLSTCYPATVDTSKASKIKELIIGNATVGYDNPSMTTLTTGANSLLEVLNIENVSGLTQALNLTALNNLRELYAHGSNIGGVTFADGGRIEIAELPAINSMTMKNLMYLTTLDIADFSKLTTLTVENCSTVDLVAILDRAPNINRIRLTGVEWTFDNTAFLERLYTFKGIDKNGYNTDQSVLAGNVHVSIIREQQLYEYRAAWPDLEITFNTLIEQYPVTFQNDDGTVLEVQYVDKGANATDPVAMGRIPVPTKESSISTDYTYAGWDVSLESIFSERTITAIYTGTTRTYTVKYVSKGITMQESTGLYGDYIDYVGPTPTYTLEEGGYKYHLFKKWDKSGYIDGNKTIQAVFDEFSYTDTVFDGKELSDLSNVEIYTLSKLGVENTSMVLEDGDPYSIRLGYDVDFDDVESQTIVENTVVFDGTNQIDTGIDLFRADRDFVLALDYEFISGTAANSVLAQCFRANGSSGFKLEYNNGVHFTWGTTDSSTVPGYVGYRDMLVLRHKRGENVIHAYMSNLNATASINVENLTTTKDTIIDSTFVLGCAKADDGDYEAHALGNVHWCKVWFTDLGDNICRKLANWTHEEIDFEMCGQKRFYLTSDSNKRCAFSLLASHVMERRRMYNATRTTAGGWAASTLNKFLNSRVYNAVPPQTQLILKQVTVQSSAGSGSSEISTSECYITIPAIIEISNSSSYNVEPYISEMAIASGKTISYMTSNAARIRKYDGGDAVQYWLRSPNVNAGYTNYIYSVDSTGYVDGYEYANYNYGVLLEISF